MNLDNVLSFSQIMNWTGEHWLTIILFLGIFFEITPIKFNPLSAVVKLIYKPVKKDIDDIRKELNDNIENLRVELKEEINEIKIEQQKQSETVAELIFTSEMNEISRIRWEIVEFSRSIDNAQLHTRDEYRHIKDENNRYHILIKKNKLTNGLIDEEMEKINKHYDANKESTSVYF